MLDRSDHQASGPLEEADDEQRGSVRARLPPGSGAYVRCVEHSLADLGRALRLWRERVSPATVGVAQSTARRRTPGLRREDLGLLAGVSADYVKRLEQGRGRPSMAVIGALSRALRLSRDEYEHLCGLAGYVAAGEGQVPTHITPSAHRLLDRLGAGPVGVFTAAWTQLAANASWVVLWGDPALAGRQGRNLVWSEFTGTTGCIPEPAEALRFRGSLVADLRQAAARYPADRELAALVARMRRTSEEFGRLWDGVPVSDHGVHRTLVVHPEVGHLHLDLDILTIHGGDLRVALFTAEPGSDDADRLALLEVIGGQDFAAEEPARS